MSRTMTKTANIFFLSQQNPTCQGKTSMSFKKENFIIDTKLKQDVIMSKCSDTVRKEQSLRRLNFLSI